MKIFILSLIITLTTILPLSGCGGNGAGGLGKIYDETVTVKSLDKDNKPVITTTHKVTTDLVQPDNPKTPAEITYTKKPDGNTVITVNTGASYNVGELLAQISLLRIPMFVGVGLIVGGGLLCVFTKQMKWGLGIAAVGAIMAIGSYLLAKYAIYFLIGFLILIAYGIYLLRDYYIKNKASDELVTTVEAAKSAGIIDPDQFAKVADSIQTKSTRKLVDKVQGS